MVITSSAALLLTAANTKVLKRLPNQRSTSSTNLSFFSGLNQTNSTLVKIFKSFTIKFEMKKWSTIRALIMYRNSVAWTRKIEQTL